VCKLNFQCYFSWMRGYNADHSPLLVCISVQLAIGLYSPESINYHVYFIKFNKFWQLLREYSPNALLPCCR